MLLSILNKKKNILTGLALFKRDLLVKKQKSPYMLFWDIVEPLLLALFFIFLYKKRVFSVPGINMDYGLYVAFGMLLWQSFSESITQPINIMDKYSNLFSHVKIIYGTIFYTIFFSLIYNLFFRVLILMLIMVYYQIYSPANIICFLIGSVFIILPGLAIGFFLASFSFFKEDIKRIVGLILRPLMFASATIFPMPKVGVLSYVDSYNPVAVMINNIRSLAINADFYDFGVFCIWVILLFSFLLFSWKLFKFSIVFAIDRL